MITIIDTGMANVGSVQNIIRYLGYNVIISNKIDVIENATKLILPGVGSFDTGMNALKNMNLIEVLNKCVIEEKKPILGICLGMQMMTRSSDEGIEKGLGWFEADTIKFNPKNMGGANDFRIPHMGWNQVESKRKHDFFLKLGDESRFYFVHSYYVKADSEDDVMATTKYGIEFHSALQRENIYAVQYHPEKSHKFGMFFLSKFIEF